MNYNKGKNTRLDQSLNFTTCHRQKKLDFTKLDRATNDFFTFDKKKSHNLGTKVQKKKSLTFFATCRIFIKSKKSSVARSSWGIET